MSSKAQLTAVAALMRGGERILLVEQQGPDHPEPTWALPGGLVEPGELLLDGLSREVREETGLRLVDPGSLLYVAQIEGGPTSWMAFIFDVCDWTGDLKPDDPDGYILDARFVPVQEAIGRLDALPWRFMREPIVTYLRGDSNRGTLWCYREREDGELSLIECVPGTKRGGKHLMP